MNATRDPIIGLVLTMPDGPWKGKRVRVVGLGVPAGATLPLPYYTLQRLDTGERGHRMSVQVMLMAAEQGLLGGKD